jgi:ABC-type Fe3+ transport system permease subunit
MPALSQHAIRKAVRRSLVAFTTMAMASACYAQSCALCYTQAASSGSRIIQGLRSGILVLVIPPMFMSVGITILAYRKRNQYRSSDRQRERQDW